MKASDLLTKYGPNRIWGIFPGPNGTRRVVTLWDRVASYFGKTVIYDLS